MTFEEALKKLELYDGASAEDAKRAYHKLLKVNKPEVDRDAFIALREAYDCVRFTFAMRTRLEASVGEEAAPIAPARATETAPSAAPRPEVEPPAPSSTASADPEAAPAEREGDRFAQLVESRDYRGAAEMLCEAFDRLADRPNVVPPVLATLQTMLACHANNQAKMAGELEQRFAAWLERSGLETSLDPQPIAMWAIARELTALSSSVPIELRAPIAEAALSGDLGKVKYRLATLSEDQPSRAATLLEQLKKKAPTLASTLGDAFVVSSPAPRPARSSSGWGKYWVITIVAINLIRLCSSNFNDTSSPRPVPVYSEATERAPSSSTAQAAAQRAVLERLSKLSQPQEDVRRVLGSVLRLVDAAVETAKRCGMTESAQQASAVGTQVRKGDCSMARAGMWIVIGAASGFSDNQRACLGDAFEELERNLRIVCPDPSDPPAGSAR